MTIARFQIRRGELFARLGRSVRPLRFVSGTGPEPGPITLDRCRVFILPTRYGVGCAVLLLVMLFGSLNYGNNPGVALTFLLGSLSLVSIFHTYRNLSQLTFHAGRPEPVFAGQEARFPIGVENRSGGLRRDIRLGVAAGSETTLEVAEGVSTCFLLRSADRRGLLHLGRFTVETRFPLSLFRAWAPLEVTAVCMVYPRPGPPGPWHFEGQEGSAPSGEKGRGQEDFSGLRNYMQGDPPRQIHWKGSARAGELLSKEFSGSAQGRVWLDWKDFPALGVEERLSRLCRMALDAHVAGVRWGLRIPGVEIETDRGPEHLHRCLGAMATFRGAEPAEG